MAKRATGERSIGRVRGTLMRLAPATARSRITLQALLVTLAVLLTAVGSFVLAERLSRPAVASEHATEALDRAEVGLQALVSSAEAHLTALQYSPYLAEELAKADDVDYNGWMSFVPQFEGLATSSGASCVLLVNDAGRTVYSIGAQSDVARIRVLIPTDGAVPVRGFVDLEDGPAALSIQPVLGSPLGGTPQGWVAIGIPATVDDLGLEGSTVLTEPGPDTASRDGRKIEHPYFGNARVIVTGAGYMLAADIPSVDGVSAGVFEHTASGVWSLADSVLGVTVLLATGFAALAGIIVGLTGSRSLAREIQDVTEHVRRSGAAALQGMRVEPAPHDPYMAEELATLLDVFDRLLDNAQRRQNEVEAARLAVEDAKRSAEVVVNESPEGKLLVQEGRIVLANPAAANIIGMPATEIVGLAGTELLAAIVAREEDGEQIPPEEIIARSAERPWRMQIDRPDGSTRWVELRATTHPGDAEFRSFLLSGRDVTEEKRVEELRREIVSLVSHDLRAPLTVIMGYIDLLRARELKPDAREKALTQARDAADRMLTLLGDLLDVARADEILSPAVLAPVGMDEVVGQIVNSFGATATHRFSLELEEGSDVLGDDKRLRQVVANLVTNAMKYSPEGSDIRVEVVQDDNRVLFSVEDEGPGIPEAQRQRIFERYTRVQQSESGKRAGIGLGLYIVKAIVEGHGGTVRVEDPEESMGSRFVVDLPAAPVSPPDVVGEYPSVSGDPPGAAPTDYSTA